MADLKKELDSNKTIMVMVPSESYNDVLIGAMKSFSGKSVCYVTLNKTAEAIKEMLKKKKIKTKDVVFIDGITKTIRQVADSSDGIYYVASPAAMTDISILINRMLKHDFEYLIFDSLTSLLVYESKAPVAKFVSALTNNIRASKTRAAFFALAVKEQSTLLAEAGMFVDRVVDLSKSS